MIVQYRRSVALPNGECGCPQGMYLADGKCNQCGARLSSRAGSSVCDVCDASYYRDSVDVIATAENCKECLAGGSIGQPR